MVSRKMSINLTQRVLYLLSMLMGISRSGARLPSLAHFVLPSELYDGGKISVSLTNGTKTMFMGLSSSYQLCCMGPVGGKIRFFPTVLVGTA